MVVMFQVTQLGAQYICNLVQYLTGHPTVTKKNLVTGARIVVFSQFQNGRLEGSREIRNVIVTYK